MFQSDDETGMFLSAMLQVIDERLEIGQYSDEPRHEDEGEAILKAAREGKISKIMLYARATGLLGKRKDREYEDWDICTCEN